MAVQLSTIPYLEDSPSNSSLDFQRLNTTSTLTS